MEQFDDILRTFINETNKFENRVATVRDEEKMLEVKKLMLESLLSYRFRGATLSHEELFVAPANVVVDEVAPMEIGMAAKDDGESLREGGENELWILRCRLKTKEQAKEHEVLEGVRVGTNKDTTVAKMEEEQGQW